MVLWAWAGALAAALLALALRTAWWVSRRRAAARSRGATHHAFAEAALPLETLVVLGSGGHTTEMLGLLRDFDQRRYRCDFVLADTDSTSVKRLAALRPDLAEPHRFHHIPRSREVGQPWSSSAVTTAWALLVSLGLVWRLRPKVLLVNGPGTCVPVVAAALLFELLVGRTVVVIFVESVCRVRSLSLTGRLLYPLADVFVVQWPELVERYPRAQHCGVLL